MDNNRVLIVNDYAGVGKVAANVVSPILSAAQFEPFVLPTLLLSSNADAEGPVITQKTTHLFEDYFNHWDQLEFDFSGYATGYFGDIKQIKLFKDYFLKKQAQNPDVKLFVDPTMGEDGELYPGFDQDVLYQIAQLFEHADIVFPNITEACLIADYPYKKDMDDEELAILGKKLYDLGAKNIIITGVKRMEKDEQKIGFFYYNENHESQLILHNYYPEDLFGTGDIVFSLILSFYFYGFSIAEAIKETSTLTEKVFEDTLALNRAHKYGPYFEPMLFDFTKRLKELKN